MLCACVSPEHGTAGEPGAVAGVSGCRRVEGGVGRSAVPVVVARRPVSIGTRRNHEWALSGFLGGVVGYVMCEPTTVVLVCKR